MKNDGGSAFPLVKTEYDRDRNEYTGNVFSTGGMTLRDYFAAKAMQSLVIAHEKMNVHFEDHRQGEVKHYYREHVIATAAYMFADAMLLVRDK